jgi:hypothetical protein
MRYRSAVMAEFMRSLRTLKALQAEQAAVLERSAGADLALQIPVMQLVAPAPVRARPSRPEARRAHAGTGAPNEPERAVARPQYLLTEPPAPGALHEPAALWLPNEPERAADQPPCAMPRRPDRRA